MLRDLENFIIISMNKTRLLIWILKQQIFIMNNKKQSPCVFYKKAVLKNFSIFKRKYLCLSFFLIKLPNFRSANLLKRDSNTGVFLWILQNFWKRLILKKICEWLLLNNVKWKYSSMKTVKYVLNVSPHSQENTFTGVSFFHQKEFLTLVFSWQVSEIFNNDFLKGYDRKGGPSRGTPGLHGSLVVLRPAAPWHSQYLRIPWATGIPRTSWSSDPLEPQDLRTFGKLPLPF